MTRITDAETPQPIVSVMKSNKQRRAELKARKQARREKPVTGYGEVVVNPSRLAASGSYSTPEFVRRGVYRPVSFACKSCGKEEVWTPHQQKWWYEIARGNPFSGPKFCRPCRARERARKAEARHVHLEGLARKAAEKAQKK